mmetsp:Transcript_50673/g.107983  ORF Transcript_50673/g.107983 Transcript_50673/m.107983 type:complete len:263 (+) Transcript_50673:684-1472(+)
MLVLLLYDNKIQIPRSHPRLFVGHALERDGLPWVHPLLHVDGELYLLGLCLAIRTLLAVVPPHFPRCDAPFVALLNLLDEAGRDLLHLHLHPRSLALLLIPHTLLPINAEGLPHVLHLDDVPEIKLLQREAEGDVDVGGALLALSPPPAAEAPEAEVAEDVVEAPVPSPLSLPLLVLLEPLLPVPVVDPLLLLVGENLVRVRDLGELLGGPLLLVLVRVEFERLGAVGLLDFFGSCRSLQAQELVEILSSVNDGGGRGEEGE